VSAAAFDVARARRETPGCAQVAHFDNAGSSLPPALVLDAVVEHLRLEARLGGYRAAAEAEAQLERVYDAVAALLGCRRQEVAFVESATRAWDAAFGAFRFRPGDRVLVSRAEYASNVIALLQARRRDGVEVEVVPDDEWGQLDVEALARRIDERVALVAVTHVPTQGGLVNPAEAIGAVTRAAGVPFLLDACQSVGQVAVDVGRIGCDLLSATGRKFLRGPRGSGFLYVHEGLLDRLEPYPADLFGASWTAPDRYELRPDARRFECFERFVAGQVGLGVAVDYALGWGLDAIEARVTGLASVLRERLSGLPGVTVHDLGRRRCGIVTFTVEGHPPAEVAAYLRHNDVNVSVSQAASARFDLPSRGLEQLVRASVHYYNDDEELARLVDLIAALPVVGVRR
jgi:selenocysteine lyase/cysteine desulfurase